MITDENISAVYFRGSPTKNEESYILSRNFSRGCEKIEKSGFNSPEVYASTSSGIAQSFGNRHGKGVKTLKFNVPKKAVKETPPGKVVKTDGQRGTTIWGKDEYSVAMDRDYARKHMTKSSDGVVHAPKVPVKYRHHSPFKQRTKIRPKKK